MELEKGWLGRQFDRVKEDMGQLPNWMREVMGEPLDDGVERVLMCSVCHRVYRKYKLAVNCYQSHKKV